MRERLSRLVYALLWYGATPIIMAYLLWRARRQPAYRRGWGQRFFGRYAGRTAKPCIWIHAVSVGETRAAAPLIEALLARHPGFDVLLTHMTPTGQETAEALFGDRVRHAYLAYDYPHATTAFLRHWRPRIGLVMETEIWPNLMAAAARAAVPMLLVNARLSARSLVSARRWPSLMRPAARGFFRILAQTEADAQRFAFLTDSGTGSEGGAVPPIVVGGNVKFDIEVPEAQRRIAAGFRSRIGDSARLFLCASTRDGEEDAILDAWKKHGRDRSADGRRLLLVIVPRHPQRFDAVVDRAATRGFNVQRRSDDALLAPDTQVWIGDSMGELAAYYLTADVAYVGGSIVPLGGQNLIEAAACGCPILIGRHTFNFTAASEGAVRVGAAARIADFDQLILKGLELVDDAAHRRRMSEAGIAFAAAHRGATRRTMEVVDGLLGGGESPSAISSP
jgi:3-deoxy-D-manno-octulosonic-acid transferase